MTVPRGPVVRALFARIVRRYDLLNSILSLGMVGRWRRFTLAHSGLRLGDAALDVCAGTGTLSVELARQVGPGGRVVGLDFCGPMLDDARRRFPPARWPQLSFTEGDAHRLPYADGAWQAVTMAFGLRNLEVPGQALGEVHRVLAPGGRAFILELTRPRYRWLAALHRWFLRRVVPWLGGLISGDWEAYRWLSTSVAGFMEAALVADLMRQSGFKDVQVWPLSGGICTLVTGSR